MIFFKKSSKSKPQTDAEYLAKYRALGNLEDLGFLYEKYMEMVFAVCYKYLGNEEESLDLKKLKTLEVGYILFQKTIV